MGRQQVDRADERDRMVGRLRADGITDERVLTAMRTVPRERFVASEWARDAYAEQALPIAAGQTISAPKIVALMAAGLELSGDERVLDVGAGSGYASAVLSRLAAEVVAIEVHEELTASARAVLEDLGYDNVDLRTGDGTRGAPDRAPFDAISVAAMAAGDLPRALVDQLSPGGTLICPVSDAQGAHGDLIRYRDGRSETLAPVAFVPLTQSSDD